ncbi:hypothetical protein FNF29_07814 [Cafeteria roenbergensis]|uniref:Uncharacterized protein n=1 Tax=Cafeteria roenbergensis TaxID=33653 RepID=A0A5A8C1R6_CAFRO|nr:hypothetical protein FNF29_07814 [Cafeteria roenbergensis]|eukprot:KAA0146838.1 hypothetical protein FNF29_07814 [Cafeteria roenbergensis]
MSKAPSRGVPASGPDKVALDALLEDVVAKLPSDRTESGLPFGELVSRSLRRLYDDPPVTACSISAGRPVGGHELRRVLFAPQVEAGDAAVYASLLAPLPASMPASNPRRRLQSEAVVLLQLRHAERWPLLSALIQHGALSCLAAALSDRSEDQAAAFRRAQALDLLTRATSHPAFPWFEPVAAAASRLGEAATPAGRRAAVEEATRLHSAMLALAPPRPFLADLIRLGSDPAPGVSSSALRLLAFWLSWARRMHTADGVLRLSAPMLAALRSWGNIPDAEGPPPLPEPGKEAAVAPADPKVIEEDDVALAATLWHSGAGDVAGWLAEAADLKARGNAAFAAGKDLAAAAWYRAAAAAVQDGTTAAGSAPAGSEGLFVDSLANCAAALLRAGEGGGTAGPDAHGQLALEEEEALSEGERARATTAADALPPPSEWRELLRTAEDVCSALLAGCPGHAKGLWRRARARRALGGEEALRGAAADVAAAVSVMAGGSGVGSEATVVCAQARRCNRRVGSSGRQRQVLQARALQRLIEQELSDLSAARDAASLGPLEAAIFREMAPDAACLISSEAAHSDEPAAGTAVTGDAARDAPGCEQAAKPRGAALREASPLRAIQGPVGDIAAIVAAASGESAAASEAFTGHRAGADPQGRSKRAGAKKPKKKRGGAGIAALVAPTGLADLE